MNTLQLNKLIAKTFLKLGDKAVIDRLMASIQMDLAEMNSGCKREHVLYLSQEIDSKKQEVIDIIESS